MHDNSMHVRPSRSDLRVIDPRNGRPIDAAGAHVERNGYWMRRLHQGDVVLIEASEQPAPAPASKGSKPKN